MTNAIVKMYSHLYELFKNYESLLQVCVCVGNINICIYLYILYKVALEKNEYRKDRKN